MPHKILIVEDNDNNRSLFRDILTCYDYDVSVAADGVEGVALARGHGYLARPVNPRELPCRVKEWLAAKESS